MRSDDAEEFLRGHVRRNVRRAVGVHRNDVVFVFAPLEVQTPVADDDVQVGHRHAEIFAPYADDFGVEFIAVNGDVTIDGGQLVGGGTGGKSDDGDAFDFRRVFVRVKIGTGEHLVPGTVVLQGVRAVNGMHALPFVQAQERELALLLDLNVVVRRLGLVYLPNIVLDRLICRDDRDHRKQYGHPQIFEHLFAPPEFSQSRQRNEQQDEAEQ